MGGYRFLPEAGEHGTFALDDLVKKQVGWGRRSMEGHYMRRHSLLTRFSLLFEVSMMDQASMSVSVSSLRAHMS